MRLFQKRSSQVLALFALALLASIHEAEAQPQPTEEHIIILIDRSGSMQTTRSDGRTRFNEAIRRATEFVNLASTYPRLFAVWTFEGTSYYKNQGFNTASVTRTTLSTLRVGSGTTPLAYTLCDAVDSLLTFKPGTFATKVIRLASDGQENSTPSGTQCYGPSSTTQWPTLTTGSWQWKVRNKLRTGSATNSTETPFTAVLHVDVFSNYISLTGAADSAYEVSDAGDRVAPSSTMSQTSFYSFLQGLASASGGSAINIGDSAPAPVLGDTNGDYCVNNLDYNLVMANYGLRVPPADARADLNRDGIVEYYDYSIVMNNWGKGTGCSATRASVP
jgi:hypothetical protein